MKFPFYSQLDKMDCGPTCLRMIASFHGRTISISTLRELTQVNRTGVSLLGLAEGAEKVGLRTNGVQLTVDKLAAEAVLPCILHWQGNHFVVLYKVSNPLPTRLFGKYRSTENEQGESGGYGRGRKFHIADPAKGIMVLSEEEFVKKWLSHSREREGNGMVLLLEPGAGFFKFQEEKSRGLRLSFLLNHLWRYRKLLVQLACGMLLGSLLQSLFPILNQAVVDVGIGTLDLPFINVLLLAQMVLLASSVTVDFLRSWILLHIGSRLNLTILSEFMSKLLRLPASFFDTKRYGDIIQRLNDHQRIETFLTGHTINFVFSIFNLFVFGILLGFYSLQIVTIAVLSSVLYGFWVSLFLNQRRKIDKERFGILSTNQTKIVQIVQGLQDIKLSGSENTKRWEWERIQAMLFRCNVKSLSLSQIQQAGSMLINQSKNILITFIAAKSVIDGNLSLGGMMSIQYILGQFNAPVEQMISFLQSFQDAQISLERLNEVHSLEDEEPVDKNLRSRWASFTSIEIDGLTYTYPGADKPVLKDVNLIVPSGKTTAIVGKSGSGKTTLLKTLLRFHDPADGQIAIVGATNAAGHPEYQLSLEHISHRAWRRNCGVVMQESFIFSDTIARNIAVDGEIIDEEKLEVAAKSANISSFIESLPQGFNTKIGPDGTGLSQGQKQRILIARAIYKSPSILFFDEATNALDASNESIILQNLKTFFRGRTVIVVAHRLSTVRDADQIVVMDSGRIVEIGDHESLLEKKGHYFSLVESQLK